MENKENQKVYIVTTENDVEGKSTKILGYATGDPDSIKQFFDDKKWYSIYLDEIELIHITEHLVEERKSLLKTKGRLEQELEKINTGLLKQLGEK